MSSRFDSPGQKWEGRLTAEFFEHRDTLVIAKSLLGGILCHDDGEVLLSGRIVETEAYVGKADQACHASRGKTERNAVMFSRYGHAYVYQIYGIHHCLNVVTEGEGFPAAVLIRALEPVSGISTMQHRRGQEALAALASGPGKLCQALGITRPTHNGIDLLTSTQLWIKFPSQARGHALLSQVEASDDLTLPSPEDIVAAPRIGVEYAGEDALLPWRFFIRNNAHVSRGKKSTAK